MNEATDYCSWICSKLPGVKLKNDIEDEFDANMVIEKYRLHIDEDDSVARVEYDLEADSVWSDDDRGSDDGRSDIKKNKITAFGKSMSLKTAMAIYANGGYNSLPGQSRASRFFTHNFRPISLRTECNNNNCEKYSAGDYGVYASGCNPNNEFVRGKIILIAYRKRARGLVYPSYKFCACIARACTLWVYSRRKKKIFKVKRSLK